MFDAFFIEAAISQKMRWPSFLLAGLPTDAPHDGELRFRINRLWAPNNNNDAWWLGANRFDSTGADWLQDEDELALIEAVPAKIQDCMEKIRLEVLPFFAHWRLSTLDLGKGT